MYHEITPEMTIGDLVKSGAYGQFANYFFTDMTPDHWNCPIKNYGIEKTELIPALHRLEDLASSGQNYIYQLYSEEENYSEWDKARVQMAHLPGPKENQPYVIVIPGGGFNRQWGLIEGLAVAAHFNQLGYSAFVLFYRTKQEPLMPKPIEDMYACIRYIEAHAKDFHVQAGHYMIGGFSAGATISSEIGSTNLGWQTAGVPKPETVFLCYPAVRMMDLYDIYTSFPADHPAHLGTAPFLRRLGGPEFTKDTIAPYQLLDYMDSTYPPVFLIANEDDKTVPFNNSSSLAEKCQELQIPHRTKFGKIGDHSFGVGNTLEVEGWMEEAVSFWKENSK